MRTLGHKTRMPWDWGGGYYPPSLMQAGIIKQLLMYGVTEGQATDGNVDIPTGRIYGLWRDDNGVWQPSRQHYSVLTWHWQICCLPFLTAKDAMFLQRAQKVNHCVHCVILCDPCGKKRSNALYANIKLKHYIINNRIQRMKIKPVPFMPIL